MHPLLDKLACQRDKKKKKKKEHKEHKGEREREIPDVSDMRAIKLISQHVYTQRTAAVYYPIVW